MTTIIDIHFGLAFLVALCALIFSWNTMGRRVVNAVLGLQVLVGLVLAATMGMQHLPLPRGAVWHIAGAIVALGLYGAASAAGKRAGGERTALILAVLGLIAVGCTLYLGMHMLAGGE
jgi:hypothetical protein